MNGIPAGWYPHPQYPGYMYNAAGEMQPIPGGAPAAPAVAPAAPAVAPVMQTDQMQDPLEAWQDWHGQTPEELDEAHKATLSNFDDELWLNFPDFPNKPKRPGDTSIINFRCLPVPAHLTKQQRRSSFERLEMRIHASLWPAKQIQSKSKDGAITVVSWNTREAGSDPIWRAVSELMAACKGKDEEKYQRLKRMEPRQRIFWQVLNLDDLNAHWQQRKENGQVVRDASGNPVNIMKPAILGLPKTAHGEILLVSKQAPNPNDPDKLGVDPSDPHIGFSIQLMKTFSGPEDMHISYRGDRTSEPMPLPQDQVPVLLNLIDLSERFGRYEDEEAMNACANAIRQRYGMRGSQQVPQGYSQPYPPQVQQPYPPQVQQPYPPQVQQPYPPQVQQAAPPQPPPVVPPGAPQPPAGAAPGGAPQPASGQQLPPPTPPGMVQGVPSGPMPPAPAAATQAPPTVPQQATAPPPGAAGPPGMANLPAPPPPPPDEDASTPEQLETQLGGDEG